MKNSLYIISLLIVLSSCSGSKFLNRKYTSGRFIGYKTSLKHNSIYTDTTSNYSSLNNQIELKKQNGIIEHLSEKEVIDIKVKSIVKKDSIFLTRRRGKDKIVVKSNNLPDVKIFINGDKKVIKVFKSIEPERIKQRQELKIKRHAILALVFSLIPFAGLILALIAKKAIRNYRKNYPLENKNKYMAMSNLAICISIIPTIAAVLIVLLGLVWLGALVFSAFA